MWDFRIDPETGDWVFGPTRHFLGVTGPELVEQRVLTRCRIPRGTFAYDDVGTLGSRLHTISRYPSHRQVEEAPVIIQEALEPMSDEIRVGTIEMSVTEDNRLLAIIDYTLLQVDTGDTTIPDTEMPEFSTRVTI